MNYSLLKRLAQDRRTAQHRVNQLDASFIILAKPCEFYQHKMVAGECLPECGHPGNDLVYCDCTLCPVTKEVCSE